MASWVNGRLAVTSWTAPASYITTAEVKTWCKIDVSDDDTLIGKLILTAIRAAENYMWRALGQQTLKLYLPNCPEYIYLNRSPYIGTLTVKYINSAGTLTTMVSGTDYKVQSNIDPVTIKIINFPNYDSNEPFPIVVQWDAGYASAATIPDDIRTGVLMIIANLYENRQDSSQMDIKMLPINSRSFLDPYRVKVY